MLSVNGSCWQTAGLFFPVLKGLRFRAWLNIIKRLSTQIQLVSNGFTQFVCGDGPLTYGPGFPARSWAPRYALGCRCWEIYGMLVNGVRSRGADMFYRRERAGNEAIATGWRGSRTKALLWQSSCLAHLLLSRWMCDSDTHKHHTMIRTESNAPALHGIIKLFVCNSANNATLDAGACLLVRWWEISGHRTHTQAHQDYIPVILSMKPIQIFTPTFISNSVWGIFLGHNCLVVLVLSDIVYIC